MFPGLLALFTKLCHDIHSSSEPDSDAPVHDVRRPRILEIPLFPSHSHSATPISPAFYGMTYEQAVCYLYQASGGEIVLMGVLRHGVGMVPGGSSGSTRSNGLHCSHCPSSCSSGRPGSSSTSTSSTYPINGYGHILTNPTPTPTPSSYPSVYMHQVDCLFVISGLGRELIREQFLGSVRGWEAEGPGEGLWDWDSNSGGWRCSSGSSNSNRMGSRVYDNNNSVVTGVGVGVGVSTGGISVPPPLTRSNTLLHSHSQPP